MKAVNWRSEVTEIIPRTSETMISKPLITLIIRVIRNQSLYKLSLDFRAETGKISPAKSAPKGA